MFAPFPKSDSLHNKLSYILNAVVSVPVFSSFMIIKPGSVPTTLRKKWSFPCYVGVLELNVKC